MKEKVVKGMPAWRTSGRKVGGGAGKGRNERRAVEMLRRRPDLTDRKIAKESGVSAEFVKAVRAKQEDMS